MLRRRRRKRFLPRIRFKRRFPFISLGGARKHFSSCKARLATVDRHLVSAMKDADRRGYTGMLHSKGALFDEPRVKALMRKRDALLKKC